MGSICSVLSDICTGHECFPSRSNSSSCSRTYAENKLIFRKEDNWSVHCCTHPECPHGCHPSTQAGSSSSVLIENQLCARIGDAVACGGSIAGPGAPSVIVG